MPKEVLFMNKKTNFRSFIYSRSSSSTYSVNLMKIGLLDFEIIGVTEIVKNRASIFSIGDERFTEYLPWPLLLI